jgi:hypothetical protein
MITVEFFSIPKLRAGVGQLAIDASGPKRLDELLGELAETLPDFATGCLDEDGQLQRHYLAILDAQESFQPAVENGTANRENQETLANANRLKSSTSIPNHSIVLILSADAGG